MATWSQECACGAPSGGSQTVIATPDSSTSKRDIWDLDNTTWPRPGYTYQVSPYFKPAAVLRECTGSIVTSYDTIHANLNGRGQTFVSQRNNTSCVNNTCGAAQIRLYSGHGNFVTIIKEDIFFPGGVIHIADRYVTLLYSPLSVFLGN